MAKDIDKNTDQPEDDFSWLPDPPPRKFQLFPLERRILSDNLTSEDIQKASIWIDECCQNKNAWGEFVSEWRAAVGSLPPSCFFGLALTMRRYRKELPKAEVLKISPATVAREVKASAAHNQKMMKSLRRTLDWLSITGQGEEGLAWEMAEILLSAEENQNKIQHIIQEIAQIKKSKRKPTKQVLHVLIRGVCLSMTAHIPIHTLKKTVPGTDKTLARVLLNKYCIACGAIKTDADLPITNIKNILPVPISNLF